jgi:hypothetical protein
MIKDSLVLFPCFFSFSSCSFILYNMYVYFILLFHKKKDGKALQEHEADSQDFILLFLDMKN